MQPSAADKIISVKADALPLAGPDECARCERGNEVRGEPVHEVSVELTADAPTAAERRAVEDFFDWLFAQAFGPERGADGAS